MADTRETWSYAGFISYSHTGDSVFAAQLQRGVERFAKPWNRIRALRLFRDESNLTASPGLWTSIQTALTSSEWFVLLVSPEAAASHWCGREVEHWLETRGTTDHLLLVLTAGDLVWDRTRFDPARSTALPVALADAFPEEPLWIDARWARTTEVYDDQDPRMQRAVVDVAAAIRGLSKDELVGAAAKEFRRTTLIKRSAQGALATLLVLSIVATVIALGQRHTAVHQKHVAQDQTQIALVQKKKAQDQARIAQAGELAALSQTQLASNLGAASTLAVSGFQQDDDFSTRAALFQAAVGSPHFVTSADLGGDVAVLPTAPTTSAVVAGLDSGAVVVWHGPGTGTDPVMTLPAKVTSIAQDKTASVVIASDSTHVMITAPGLSATAVKVPSRFQVGSVAVTPDGSLAWIHGTTDPNGNRSTFIEVDVNGRSTSIRQSGLPDQQAPYEYLAAPDDDTLAMFNTYPGTWYRFDVHSGNVESTGSDEFGIHEAIFGTSPDLAYLTNANDEGAENVQVWRSTDTTSPQDTPAEATAPLIDPRALAVSPDGSQLAVADGGIVYVDGTTLADARTGLVGLTGARGSDDDHVRFLDNRRLISVFRGRLTLWDLGQSDRLGATTELPVPTACSACAGPAVALGTDGRMLVMDGNPGEGLLVQSSGRRTVPSSNYQFDYDPPLYDSNEDQFVLPVSGASSPESIPQVDGIRIWPLGGTTSPTVRALTLAAAITASDTVVSAAGNGRVYVQQATDGTLVDSYVAGRAPTAAAVSPDGKRVALVEGRHVQLSDVATHDPLLTLGDDSFATVAMTDDAVLATTNSGGLLMWDIRTGKLLRTFPDDPAYFGPIVVSPDFKIIARPRIDSQVDLVDSTSGAQIGVLAVPGSNVESKVSPAFFPDADQVVTVGESIDDVLVTIRDLTTDHLVATVCTTALKDLTEDTWRQFAGSAPYTPPDC